MLSESNNVENINHFIILLNFDVSNTLKTQYVTFHTWHFLPLIFRLRYLIYRNNQIKFNLQIISTQAIKFSRTVLRKLLIRIRAFLRRIFQSYIHRFSLFAIYMWLVRRIWVYQIWVYNHHLALLRQRAQWVKKFS